MGEPATSALATLTIGKVLAELSLEFPDITVTKIRYLEDEGLIKPERTAAGYRKFSYSDVERLRFILAGQRDNFWPLKYIRQLLDDLDNGIIPDVAGATVRVPTIEVDANGIPEGQAMAPKTSTVRLTRAELIEASGIADDLLDEAEEFDLIKRRPNQKFYDAKALSVAALVSNFADFSIRPRHLRTLRQNAEREAELVKQVAAQKGGKQTKTELATLMVQLHATIVKNSLS